MPSTKDDFNPKDRLGALKVPLRLNPGVAIIWMALVFEIGAWKYGEFNWRNKAVRLTVYSEAIDRHNLAMRAGEDVDPESGLPHAAHIMACGAIIIDAHACGQLKDDRFEKDMSAYLLNALTASQNYNKAVLTGTRTPAGALGDVRPGPSYPDFLKETIAGIVTRREARNAPTLTIVPEPLTIPVVVGLTRRERRQLKTRVATVMHARDLAQRRALPTTAAGKRKAAASLAYRKKRVRDGRASIR